MTRIKAKADGLAWRQVGEDVVLLDERSSKYLQLQGSGVLLWLDLVNGTTVNDLIQRLRSHFGIDEATARRDVDAFILDLRRRELVEFD